MTKLLKTSVYQQNKLDKKIWALFQLISECSQKKREVDKVVVLKSKPNTPYERWIEVSDIIQKAGGIITLQLEEQRTVSVD